MAACLLIWTIRVKIMTDFSPDELWVQENQTQTCIAPFFFLARATMDTFNGIFLPPGMENPLETLVSDLCNVVERESVEIDVQKGRWIWAAACLNGLAEIRVSLTL